jgi:Domain of unknown function (DUF4129)
VTGSRRPGSAAATRLPEVTGSRGQRSAQALLPAVVVLGLLVLVWAAATGPVRMLGTTGARPDVPDAVPSEAPSATPTPSDDMPTYRELTRGVRATADLSWIGQLVAYTVLLAVCFAGYLLVRSMWRNRWRRPEKPADVTFEKTPDGPVGEALVRDAAEQLAAVEVGGPRDGIVACWLRLEEVVAASGVPLHPAETSTELATRVLQALDVDPRAVARLAELYREARFSEHPMTETGRAQARDALRTLHEDLRRAGSLR